MRLVITALGVLFASLLVGVAMATPSLGSSENMSEWRKGFEKASVGRTGPDSARGEVSTKSRVSVTRQGSTKVSLSARGTRRSSPSGAGERRAAPQPLFATPRSGGDRVEIGRLDANVGHGVTDDRGTRRHLVLREDDRVAGLGRQAYDLSDGTSLVPFGSSVVGPQGFIRAVEPGEEPQPQTAAQSAGSAPVVDVAVLAHEAAADVVLPAQDVGIGPPASLNEWNKNMVGQQLWLWIEDDPQQISETVEAGGVSLTMQATYSHSVYDMGDGNSVRCAQHTRWVKGAQPPGTASPTCGYAYHEPGTYEVSATHHWTLVWEGLGQTGSFPLTNTSSHTLEVGELQSVIVARDPMD